jgi:hypothetical protein
LKENLPQYRGTLIEQIEDYVFHSHKPEPPFAASANGKDPLSDARLRLRGHSVV